MKTLRYLLIICTLTIATAAFGQAKFKTAENKEAFEHQVGKMYYEFYSTSTMKGSGSSLPVAARNGMELGKTNQEQSSQGPHKAPPITGGEDMPVGDGVWVLLLLAMCYAFGKWRYQMMWRIMARRSSGEE